MAIVRPGMWVKVGERVGIVAELQEAAAVVHIVDEKGETVQHQFVAYGAIVQAGLEDIPAPRRPSEEIAAKFGYV